MSAAYIILDRPSTRGVALRPMEVTPRADRRDVFVFVTSAVRAKHEVMRYGAQASLAAATHGVKALVHDREGEGSGRVEVKGRRVKGRGENG
jgi:hypothetical protein